MINSIAPKIFNNRFEPHQPEAGDKVLAYTNGKILIGFGNDGSVVLPRVKQPSDSLRYLFSIDDTRYFLWDTDFSYEEKGFDYVSHFVLRTMKPQDDCFAGMVGYQLYNWYRNHRYCGKCASQMTDSLKERALVCPECGLTVYPTISPAIVVAITRGDEILLTRYAGREYQGYAVNAGFMEIGETDEDTIRREVMEEVGIRVKDIRYYGSLPWGFDSGILIGYFAKAEDGEEVRADHNELSEAKWFKRDELKEIKDPVFLGAEMMELFRTGNDPYSKESSCAR